MNNNRPSFNLFLDNNLRDRAQNVADKECCSLAALIRHALKVYVDDAERHVIA